jgi:hypothetical protein
VNGSQLSATAILPWRTAHDPLEGRAEGTLTTNTKVAVFLRTRAHNFSAAQERVGVISKDANAPAERAKRFIAELPLLVPISGPRSLCRKVGLPVAGEATARKTA